MHPKQAIVLAAGRGARMLCLTDNKPKPLLQVGERPLLFHALQKIILADISHIVVNTGYLGEQIVQACKQQDFPAFISFSNEGYPTLDTGGGIVHAWRLLAQDKPTLVKSSDIYSDYAINELALPQGSLAHLVLVPRAQHQKNADFALCADKRVSFEAADYTFSGISILHPGILDFAPQKSRFNFMELVAPAIIRGKVTGEVFSGFWCDVGTKERLAIANAQATLRRPMT